MADTIETLEFDMLVWLASYPRSGNTYVRIVLHNVFGIKTYSLHPEGDNRVFLSRAGVVDLVGHETDAPVGQQLIDEARRSNKLYIIKTHEKPLTDDPAIVIIRDGRSALVSYYHYCRDIEGLPVGLDDLIQGHVYAGSWSEHAEAWLGTNNARPTLVLRYEEITNDLKLLTEKLRDFCKIEPVNSLGTSFSQQNSVFPEFFRKGNDGANIEEMNGSMPSFNQYHGDTMHRLGYS